MIKYLPKFSAPNRAVPVSFTAAQKMTPNYSQVFPTMSGGWAVFYPSSGAIQTRIVYVDPDNGHATGLIYNYGDSTIGSDPLLPSSSVSGWLSPEYAMDAVYQTHGTSGSFWFLLKRGSVFNTGVKLQTNIHESWPFRGLSAQYPALVDAYGSVTGDRPKITCAETSLILLGSPSTKSNVAFKSIDWHSVRRDPAYVSYEFDNVVNLNSAAIRFYTSSDPTEIHVLDDCRFAYFKGAINSDSEDPYYNLLLNRCQFEKIYALNGQDSTACYFGGVANAEIIDCVVDKAGHYPYDPSGRSPGSTRNHAFYVAGSYNDQFKFRGNIINQPSYGGIQLRGGSGHLVSGNVIMRAGFAIPFGHDQNNYNDVYADTLNNSFIRFHQADIIKNLIMKPSNILGATGSYDGNNARGEGIGAGRINSMNMSNNILTRAGTSSGNCIALSFSEFSWPWDNTTHPVLVSGNIVYDWIGSRNPAGSSVSFGVTKTVHGSPYIKLPENNFKFVKNYLIEPYATGDTAYTKGVAYKTVIGFGQGSYLSSGNTFWRQAPSGSYVSFTDTASYNWQHLMNGLGDSSSVYGTGSLPVWDAVSRDDVSYIGSLGLSTASGEESFILRALANRKGSWDNRFTASNLMTYVSAGFSDLVEGSGGIGVYNFGVFYVLNGSVFTAIRKRR